MNNLKYFWKDRTGISESAIKDNFQMIYLGPLNTEGTYTYPLFDTFWENVGLRGTLFGEREENEAKIYLKTLVENTSSVIYSFINVK